MPAPIKRYYSRMEVQQILGISKGKAHEIMKMFELRGQLFMHGNTRRVRVEVFEDWLKETEKGGSVTNVRTRHCVPRQRIEK